MSFAIHLELDLDVLRAISVACSGDDKRHNLAGVSIDGPPDRLRYTATDGHRLISTVPLVWPADRWADTPEDGIELADAIIFPAGAIKELAALKRPSTLVEWDGETVRLGGVALDVPAIDGLYPDWSQLVPRPDNTPRTMLTCGYNARYIYEFQAAAWGKRDAKDRGIKIHWPADDLTPMVLTAEPPGGRRWAGVVMPMRL